jgi:RNA methyltransferase, TrmH family
VIPLDKLAKLSRRHRLRKAALVLGEVERELMARHEHPGVDPRGRYAKAVAGLLAGDPESPPTVLRAAGALRALPDEVEGAPFLRSLDALRHALISQTGQAPADWDLLDPATGRPEPGARRVMAGARAYLEDLRSPFNVGTIFRTAEAFGLEELILSPDCADPGHPRARRSAMGATDLVPWRREDLSWLRGAAGSGFGALFALELGGTPIGDFPFPPAGIIVIGSEELGVSPEAKTLCEGGVVSIPMYGIKGSLNAAVAFGIVAHAWSHGYFQGVDEREGLAGKH